MTVIKKGDAFTYAGAAGDGDTERLGSLVGIIGADGKAIETKLSSAADTRSQLEVSRSIDTKLGALLILLTEAFRPTDKPDTYLEAAERDLRNSSVN